MRCYLRSRKFGFRRVTRGKDGIARLGPKIDVSEIFLRFFEKPFINPDCPTYYEKYHSEADENYLELSEFLQTVRNAYVVEFIMKVYS